ncbi:cell division protein ZapB [Larkinella soli]|uniref:cell division protein ZapB n=1 Tax=Larkinella soli TaxID=1770527 RepID=UPI000FFC5EE5|nr:cell division protein ZapB [Larkinella soli]
MESYNQDRRNNRKNYLLVALGILAALNLLLLYFYYQERQTNRVQQTALADKTQEVMATKVRLDSISAQLDAKISEIQSLGGRVDSLLKVKEQLEADKRNLRNVAAFDARKYEAKIRNYVSLLSAKDREIAQLKEENSVLTSQNQTLTEENTTLKNERQALADTVSTYSEKNRELTEKVTIAAALKAENLNVTAINRRGKESEGGKYRAKRIDKVKVTFRLSTNPLTEQNEKEIFMRILDPSGAVIADMATGSGQFIYNGQEMVYTAKQPITYTNDGQEVSFIYGRGSLPFKEGTHSIELYSEGFKIGQGEFTVK